MGLRRHKLLSLIRFIQTFSQIECGQWNFSKKNLQDKQSIPAHLWCLPSTSGGYPGSVVNPVLAQHTVIYVVKYINVLSVLIH